MNIWILICICLLPILLFTNSTKSIRDKYPETFGYIFSVIATFVGIVIGLYVDGLQAEKEQKQKMVKIMEASKQEIVWLTNRTNTIKNMADTVSKGVLVKFLNLELPPFYTQTLRTDIANEVIHPLTYEEFNLIREQLLIDMQWIRETYALKNNVELDKKLDKYNLHLLKTNTIIDMEIKRIKGEIPSENFEKEMKLKIDSTLVEDF
jgi:hypothetical protein